jgi:phosphoglycolate phosphatase
MRAFGRNGEHIPAGACTVTDLAALNGATIAFDFDGTLVESAPDLMGSLNAILVAEGFVPLPYDQGRPFIGRGAHLLLQRDLVAADAEPGRQRRCPF